MSPGRALGQPCSACMGAETHKTDKLAVPLSQISKVNRPLPAGDWVTLGNPTLPAVNLPTIPLFTLLTLLTGKNILLAFNHGHASPATEPMWRSWSTFVSEPSSRWEMNG